MPDAVGQLPGLPERIRRRVFRTAQRGDQRLLRIPLLPAQGEMLLIVLQNFQDLSGGKEEQ